MGKRKRRRLNYSKAIFVAFAVVIRCLSSVARGSIELSANTR